MSTVEQVFLDGVLKRLRETGLRSSFRWTPNEPGANDGVLAVEWRGGRHEFPAVVKRHLRSAAVPLLPTLPDGVVVTDHVAPTVREALAGSGWSFVDASGNASLSAPGLFVHVEGRRSGKEHSPPSIALPFSRTGLPVTFALLVRGGLGRGGTQRELSVLARSSLGSTNRVLKVLRTLGHLSPSGDLSKAEALVDRWTEAYLVYRDELAPAQRFDSDRWSSPEELLAQGLPDGALLSSEAAAHRQGRSIRPETALIYCPPQARKDLIRSGRLRPSDLGWVQLRRTFWDGALFDHDATEVPDFLVRADLLAEGDPRLTQLATNWDSRVSP